MGESRSEAGYLIDRINLFLQDGGWHDLDEISKGVRLPLSKAKMILHFMSEFAFVELRHESDRWTTRIDPATRLWLQRLERVEK